MEKRRINIININMPYQTPKVNLYRNISISFVVFTVLLLVSVFFLFYSHATITVSAAEQKVNLNFNAEVRPSPSQQDIDEKDVVTGQVMTLDKSATSTFSVLSTKTVDNSAIVGKVKIVNNSTKNQTLAKTTQLQADNEVIVRTNNAVVVPAGGSVEVEVYPKDPATFQEIAPGNLVIIKLSPSLQDEIYGIAQSTISNTPMEVKVLAENDLKRAKEELLKRVADEAKKELNINEKNEVIVDVISWKASKEVGDEAESFDLQVTAKIKYVDLNNDQLDDLLDRKIANLNLAGMQTGQIDRSGVNFSIVDPNFGDGALIKINYVVLAKVDVDNSILDKENFTGKTVEEVKQYFSEIDVVDEVTVNNTPYWKKSLPGSVNKIDVIVK